MPKVQTTINAKKIVDSNTIVPGSGAPFVTFSPPVFDGKVVAFYGNNETYEGIYCSSVSNPSVQRASDNHTTISDLDGPPTSQQSPFRDAYISYPEPGDGLTPATGFTFPRLVVLDGITVFFAANWPKVRPGIFAFNPAKPDQLLTLISGSDGYFNGGAFAFPSGALSQVYFSAVGADATKKPLGIYTVPVTGLVNADPKLLLNTATAKTPDKNGINSLGNCQVRPLLPNSELFVFGKNTGDSVAMYSYAKNTLQYILQPGQEFDGHRIPVSTEYPIYNELSVGGQLMTCQVSIEKIGGGMQNYAVVCCSTESPFTPEIVCIANPLDQIPGGAGTFSGNGFQTPITDGKYIVFETTYQGSGFGLLGCLIVWNSQTKKLSTVIDANTVVDGQQVSSMTTHVESFVDGKLAIQLNLANGTQGIYVIDLSQF